MSPRKPANTKLSMKWVKGRKDYTCESCPTTIAKGTVHYHENGFFGGMLTDNRYCVECGLEKCRGKNPDIKDRLLKEFDKKMEKD